MGMFLVYGAERRRDGGRQFQVGCGAGSRQLRWRVWVDVKWTRGAGPPLPMCPIHGNGLASAFTSASTSLLLAHSFSLPLLLVFLAPALLYPVLLFSCRTRRLFLSSPLHALDMPIRNPFKRAPGDVAIHDENQPPRSAADSGFQSIKVTGSNPVEIKEPMEFKLSGMTPGPALIAIAGRFGGRSG